MPDTKKTASEKIHSPLHLTITVSHDMWESLSTILPVYKLGAAQGSTALMGSSTAVSKCMINAWHPAALLAFYYKCKRVKVKWETWLLSIWRNFNSRLMRHGAKRPCAQTQRLEMETHKRASVSRDSEQCITPITFAITCVRQDWLKNIKYWSL